MRNKYFSEGAERAAKVREMFSRLAQKYDLVNDVMSFGMHRRWKRETVALALEGRPARRLLDLCCGTGDMAFHAKDRRASLQVVGLDFTWPMLSVARRRGASSGSEARFVQGDALALPFPDASFDAITIGYGLRNIADPERAVAEMRRVLAPGGRVVVLDFGKPDNPLAGALYLGFLHTMMPAVGWIFHGDPQTYLYIPASLAKFPAQRGIERLMREAGLVNVGYENRLLGTMGLNVGEAPALR